MLSPRILFTVVLAGHLAYGAYAFMECKIAGIPASCPTVLNDDDKVFCCQTGIKGMEYCCDMEAYFKENYGILAGIIIAILLVIIVITLCCCCFCSCCCLAQRRLQRGTVLYGPITSDQRVIPAISQTSFSPYPVVHSPSDYPPPYQPPTNPNFNNAYPPAHPSFKP